MRALRLFAVLSLALVLSGCFQVRTLVRLNADGSGTVEDRVLMSSAINLVTIMSGMGMGTGMDTPPPEQPYDEDVLRARAEEMGATFVGVEEEDILFGTGYVVTYAFEDVNTLALTSDPSSFFPEEMRSEMRGDMPLGGSEEPYTFAFADGELQIVVPQTDLEEMAEEDEVAEDAAPARDPKKGGAERESADMGEDAGGMASAMGSAALVLADMRFTVAVELPNEAAQTNASFVDGRTLTLYDMDFNQLLENPEAFDRLDDLSPAGPPDFPTAMRLLSEIPGFTFESEPTVTVSLR